MTREGTIGVAALLALAAAVGLTLSPGTKQAPGRNESLNALSRPSGPPWPKNKIAGEKPGCSAIEERLKELLNTDSPLLPLACYEGGAASKQPGNLPGLADKTPNLTFVIATLPDPLHTHLSLLFDQFTTAIQEGAQDEKYDFDSSWLPWEDNAESYALLSDRDAASQRKEMQEQQPGILLFRRVDGSGEEAEAGSKGLVVFVVGEDATHGIHREQFRNALGWIEKLEPSTGQTLAPFAILGPTFSGSFPSLAELLSEQARKLTSQKTVRLSVYSGSASSQQAALWFENEVNPKVLGKEGRVEFHSFVQSDDEILRRFCAYMTKEQPGFDPQKIAVISEDETAYGSSGMKTKYDPGSATHQPCPYDAVNLYYPRDISALRGAIRPRQYSTPEIHPPQMHNGETFPATSLTRQGLCTIPSALTAEIKLPWHKRRFCSKWWLRCVSFTRNIFF